MQTEEMDTDEMLDLGAASDVTKGGDSGLIEFICLLPAQGLPQD